VFSSVVPYAADLISLRRVPVRFFGVFMSSYPVLAALAGLVILGQRLGSHEWIGIAVVVATNAVSVLATSAAPTRATTPAMEPAFQ
jgi:inner membrane transporter RhtA